MKTEKVRPLVERAFRESGDNQHYRELVVNAIEAGATHIEIGPEWVAVQEQGVYRLMVADNGKGMNPIELLNFLNTFGGGDKTIGGFHDNYGVGAKTSLLPWNHYGVVVISWTPEYPNGSMIWLHLNSELNEYGAKAFHLPDGTYEEVVQPFGEWTDIKPKFIHDHGTVVVALGMSGTEDTFMTNRCGPLGIHDAAKFLNRRFWSIPENVEIRVQSFRRADPEHWPRSLAEATSKDDTKRYQRSEIYGAMYYAGHYADWRNADGSYKTGTKYTGAMVDSGMLPLSDGTEVDWYLWEGKRPDSHARAFDKGFVAALYKNELYEIQQNSSSFRTWGISHSSVRNNLTIVVRPPLAQGKGYGVYPDTAREKLIVQGTNSRSLPWSDWASEFANNMPASIRDALMKAVPAYSSTINDSKWQNRLISYFSDRWRQVRFVRDPNGTEKVKPKEHVASTSSSGNGKGKDPVTPPRPGKRPTEVVMPQGSPNAANEASADPTAEAARKSTVKNGLPRYDWVLMSEIGSNEGIGGTNAPVAWTRPNAKDPHGLVQLARDFPMIQEVVKFWSEQYPPQYSEAPNDKDPSQIEGVIWSVYGEAMVARIAHSEHIATYPGWSRSLVEDNLRTSNAMLMSLLGLITEDHVIARRLTELTGVGRIKKDKL